MKIKEISYSRVFSLGNYENEKLGCVIQIEEGEDREIATKAAITYVEEAHKKQEKIREARRIVEQESEELPF